MGYVNSNTLHPEGVVLLSERSRPPSILPSEMFCVENLPKQQEYPWTVWVNIGFPKTEFGLFQEGLHSVITATAPSVSNERWFNMKASTCIYCGL